MAYLVACPSSMSPCKAAEAVDPGAVRKVALEVDGKTLTISMIYVPAEEGPKPGSDDGDTGKAKASQPFYFAETELTLADFNVLANAEIREAHDAREQEMASDDDQKKDWKEMQRNSKDYVAKMVSLGEAAGITAAATAALSDSVAPRGPSLVSERFRLPTGAEWRHAMSMGSQPDKKFINPWPAFDRDFSDKERVRCQDLWSTCGGQGRFVGSQEQVIWAIREASENTAERLELLTIFTRFLLKERLLDPKQANSHSWEILADPLAERIDVAPANEWGIRGAHRGYPEWVLSVASQNEAKDFWSKFESSTVSDVDRQRASFGLCGASTFTLGKDDVRPMLQAFVTHENQVVNGKSEFSWKESEDAEVCIDRSVAMRLVLVECLSDTWVALVRTSLGKQDTVAAAREASLELVAQIERLTFGLERQRSQALIDTYLALAEYRCGDPRGGSQRVAAGIPVAFGQAAAVSVEPNIGRRRRSTSSGDDSSASRKNADAVYFTSVSRLMDRDVPSPQP